jgi:peptidoglycan/LPS O-acetylase OafA/YrhL
VRRLAFACFLAASFFTERELMPGGLLSGKFIVRFIPLFLLGVATFQRRAAIVGRAEYAVLLVVAACGCVLTSGLTSTVAAMLTVAFINFYERRTVVAEFFGNISYSLYLLHWPIGHETLSYLGLKLFHAQSDAARTLIVFFSFGVCIAAAYLFYLTIERPARRWSARFRYGKRAATIATSGLAEPDVQEAPAST